MTAYRTVTRDGTDTVHRWPATESCNLDDTDNDLEISEDEAWQLITGGSADACQHCFPLPSELVP
jgi:hypothetical protein